MRCVDLAEGGIAYETSSEIHDVISRIGRTEDIKLSPDNSRLAVVDFLDNRIFLFSIRIDRTSATPSVSIFDYSILSSATLQYPHGVTFLGDDYLLVCCRYGDVAVFKIPCAGTDRHEFHVKPLKTITGKGLLSAEVKSPGSADCYNVDEDSYRVLVCNNHWHIITSHLIQIGNPIRIRNEGVLIEKALKIPDGISCSPDHAWIAISNHVHGEVLIYQNLSELNRKTPPTATLRGMVCPHGVRFAPDGKRVWVADAASQYLHVFESQGGEWKGAQEPNQSIRLLDDEDFYVGRYDSREGGLKGLDIDNSNTVLLTTRKDHAIRFYYLNELLSRPSPVNGEELAELRRQRDQSLERQKSQVLNQQWTFQTRARRAFTPGIWLSRGKKRVRIWMKMGHLYLRNRWSHETLLNQTGPVLSLTTHGFRIELVFYAIESIGFGGRKPSRLMLWLDEEAFLRQPESLQRLKSRGLEIHLSKNLGPHTKYYPYIDRENQFSAPLVTADDDTLYPRNWLQQLIESYEANPAAIHCHRALRLRLNTSRFMPYNDWGLCRTRFPSHLSFITGVSGVIYPSAFLHFLKGQGQAFLHCCPKSDDIWMTVNALRGGFKIAQVKDAPAHFLMIPGCQKQQLSYTNVRAGGNQSQLIRTFLEADFAKLRVHLVSEGETVEDFSPRSK